MAVTVHPQPDTGAPVPPDDDHACQAAADDINQQRPDWLVLWGSYSKRFVAFALFAMSQRRIVTAHYPDALLHRMDEVERRWRIRPPNPQKNHE
jgi:hypothetical protein